MSQSIPDQMQRVVIYGASGHSLALATDLHRNRRCEIVAMIDDFRGDEGGDVQGMRLISFHQWKSHFRSLPCLVAVGNPTTKRHLVDRVLDAGGTFVQLHDRPESCFPLVSVGRGSIIFSNVYVATATTVGEHVQIMPMCSIGHDVQIGDCTTIAPSCTISGYVTIEEDVYIGAGATIVNGRPGRPLVVGKGAWIAAGAVVTKSVPPGMKVVGNPARSVRAFVQSQRSATRNQ